MHFTISSAPFFSIDFIISISHCSFPLDTGLQFGFFVPVVISKAVLDIFYHNREREIIKYIE